jgi:hypothetical protein
VKYLISVASLILLQLISSASAQEPTSKPERTSPRSFENVERSGDDKWRTFFMFQAAGHDYTIRGDGFGQSTPGRARPTSFHLTIGRGGRLERVYFLEYEGDLLLTYEATDDRFGWGYVERFDPRTMKRKWIAPVSAYNLGPGLVEDHSLYLAAANFVACIDLASGRYTWQHDEIQKQYDLLVESFQPPSLENDRVIFFENGHRGRTVQVDKSTGRIMHVGN